jgi:hypothetical protein
LLLTNVTFNSFGFAMIVSLLFPTDLADDFLYFLAALGRNRLR